MVKLIIEKIDGFKYYLRDNSNNVYQLNLEFYDISRNPHTGEYIFMDSSLLKEKNSALCFGPILGKYGRNIENENNPDIMVLVIDNSKIFLKRYYG